MNWHHEGLSAAQLAMFAPMRLKSRSVRTWPPSCRHGRQLFFSGVCLYRIPIDSFFRALEFHDGDGVAKVNLQVSPYTFITLDIWKSGPWIMFLSGRLAKKIGPRLLLWGTSRYLR
jgi:hypothetical protein